MIITYVATVKDDWARYRVINALEEQQIGYMLTGQTITVEKAKADIIYASKVLELFDSYRTSIDDYGFVMTPECEHDTLQ